MKVLITGGTGTLGQALIKEFTSGNDIVFTYNNNLDKAISIEKEYGAKKIQTSELDSIKYDFDIVINNAGINGEVGVVENISVDNFNEVMNTNVSLPFKIIKNALPYMKDKQWGRIINVSSVYGIKAEEELSSYNTSKSALIGLTKSITKEYAKDGITCNAVLPGMFESDVVDKIASVYENSFDNKEDYLKEMTKSIPAGRLGKPEEIARLIKYLSSDDASYINGAIIPIDGGYLA